LILLGAGYGSDPAWAQEDLNRGKTPAQLFASDCADCHRSPRGLVKRDPGSLTGFLRVHYTANRESAAAIAAFLISLGPDPRGSRPVSTPRRPAASQSRGQAAPSAAKPGEAAAPKPSEPVPEAVPPVAPAAAPANPQ
jgi:hypothetical protein